MADTARSRAEVFEKTREILVELLRLDSIDKVKADSSLRDDLGVDSLGLADLIVTIEEEFDIDVPAEDEAESLDSVDELVTVICKLCTGGE